MEGGGMEHDRSGEPSAQSLAKDRTTVGGATLRVRESRGREDRVWTDDYSSRWNPSVDQAVTAGGEPDPGTSEARGGLLNVIRGPDGMHTDRREHCGHFRTPTIAR
jgi:hypothetical protein